MDDTGEDIVSAIPIGETDGGLRTDGGKRKLETLLAVLANRRRRYALYYLRENEVADIDELARWLTETGENPQTSANEDRFGRAKTALIHTSLPRLREAGCIEYDRRSGTVRYRRPSQSLAALLEVCSELESPSMEFE
ncbi:hypothetical protein [Natrinema sp. 74]|uniref:DUF7344 domain-containing protein n=1 Tax=Natrinema sp. 74 TaxID=3384159 RepID=UPI0038D36C42